MMNALLANHQAQEIKRRGGPVYRRLSALVLVGLAVLSVLLIRLMRPVILIRFGEIISHRIGHFAEYVEVYLSERALRIQPSRSVDIFYYSGPISNAQLKTMSERALKVAGFARWLDRVNRRLPWGEKHQITITIRTPHELGDNYYDTLNRTPVHLSFTPEEEQRGRDSLSGLGIPEGAPFVCFMARDSAYLDATFPDSNWQHHDYRDSTIQNYLPAVEELSSRGYFAVRMGSVVKESLTASNPMVIDYATNGRTDFLDIYLSTNCQFFLTSGTGIDALTTMFRKPIACVNFAILGFVHAWGPNDLFIPKKLWLRKESRFLTFREVLDSGAGGLFRTEQFDQMGIDLIENSAEEITGLAVEMKERLTGTWVTTPEDEKLQGRFWSLFEFGEQHEHFLPRIGAQFLRQNRFLLDLAEIQPTENPQVR